MVIFYLAYQFCYPSEDALILYVYAKNLANKGMITYSNALIPIEGASDFLSMLIIALLKKVGINEFASALLLNCAATFSIVLLARRLAIPTTLTLLGILFTPYLYSSLYGFNTLFFSAIYVWCLYLVILRKSEFYFAILLLCLARLDGAVWGVGLIFLHLDLVKEKIEIKKELVALLTYLIIPGLIYFGWRVWYFGEYFPLPLLVKSVGQRDLLIFFSDSLLMIGYTLIPVLLTALFLKTKGYLWKAFLLFTLPVLFYSSMRLEQDVGNRFLAPMFFGSLLLTTTEKRIKVTWIFVVISILISLKLSNDTIATVMNSKNENIFSLSSDLSQIHGKMLVTEAGRLAYYTNWDIQDSWGLNTPEYAHNLISRRQLEHSSYDLIVAHCTISMLKDSTSIPVPLIIRSWDNQCRVLTSYISSTHYDIYLVPFLKNEEFLSQRIKKMMGLSIHKNNCHRYDIYAISQNYEYNNKLKNIIISHGGILYRKNFTKYSDDSICD